MPDNDDVANLTFEAALTQLETIVQQLETGKAPLAESISIYERGEALKAHCETLLRAAEARIEKITLGRDGRATGSEPLDP
jgi:exodeoxyribonuclease VII small subunit